MVDLPDDCYGVYIENDMDKIRLKYLVEQIGEKKLKSSIDKYHKKWPDSKPYVSTLLKWYRITVPVHLYAPINVPIYYVYLLVNHRHSAMKIGVSGNWVSRTHAFSDDFEGDGFDTSQSIAVLFYSNKKLALKAERHIKNKYSDYRIQPPATVRFGAYGHKEWFSSEIFTSVLNILKNFETPVLRKSVTLKEAVEYNNKLQNYETQSPIN